MRPGLVLLALAWAAPAHADDAIGRRLAALHVLATPPREIVEVPARRSADGCPGHPWWEETRYGLATRTERAIRDASLRFGVETALIRSVIRQESAGNHLAISSAGAEGLMQLMPATARSLGVVCSFDPRENVLGGTRYLRRLHDRFGSWPRALAGYHAGPGAVERGRIPDVTRRYVRRVLRGWEQARP